MRRHLFDRNHSTLATDKVRALMAMDLDWGRRMFPGAPDADIEIAMHKARYHLDALPMKARAESALWLHERRLPDALGEPVVLLSSIRAVLPK
jgi:hypothetical protein